MSRWDPGVPNEVTFVMVDANRTEVTGLTLSIQIRTAGGSFGAAAGSWSELSGGWYRYLSTAGEAVVGPISFIVTAAGAIQQNLEYVCKSRNQNLVPWPYYVYEPDGITTIEGVKVEAYVDAIGSSEPHFTGYTNAAGAALDNAGQPPWLDPGTWYFRRKKGGVKFNNPDIEVVS